MVSQLSSTAVPQKSGHTKSMEDTPTKALSSALVKVAEQRDKTAFAVLFKYFAPKIKRFGIKQYGSEAMAMELVQDTMTSVWRKAHLYSQDKGAATTWVYTVMRNASFDALRKIKSKKEDQISEDIWPTLQEGECSNDGFNDHLQDKQIQKYISCLPKAQQEVVKGVYFQEMSQEQLAEQLNIPVGTVKSRLRLALQKLRAEMGDSHD
ncbi:sigma-70 family RNA polymerase sigma factor [Pseudoalteromonas sp. MMG012]|uniref:sigma-70 family RNA polymerase sigma factor n=1 Tax=Pseudoalteromonas sp. MMG012 TaxID=2822686 RepID=UPI001B3A45C4|nr:sigma-70 family RNA polymerase sigma factor [Pseudoalteromonas sp. MMG012]MBQ4849699.1 sigma-70 family RNA polymerase sigma factor [Pseudoalteromonas sp. MMG012]